MSRYVRSQSAKLGHTTSSDATGRATQRALGTATTERRVPAAEQMARMHQAGGRKR